MSRTRVKICGITNLEDARAAVDCGADALGFIFVEESPRYVGRFPAALVGSLAGLPPFVNRVMVCRNLSAALLDTRGDFDTIQFYMDDWCGVFPSGPKRFIHALRIKDESSLTEIETAVTKTETGALLLDAYHPDKLGGSGETFNWELAREAKERFQKPIILAGGLTPENVGDAIAAVRPYAVDVSSGVEAEPGRKDHAKLRAFMQAVRKADEANG